MSLREEVEALEARKFSTMIRVVLEQFREEAKLSDEEWWAELCLKHDPDKLKKLEKAKDEILAKRRERTEEALHQSLNDYRREDMDRLLPILEAIRTQKKVDGPVDREDLERARRISRKATSGEQVDYVRRKLSTETDPSKRSELEKILTFFGAYEEDIAP